MIEAKITSGLQANSIYSGSITFSDTSSQYIMLFSFGKCLIIIFKCSLTIIVWKLVVSTLRSPNYIVLVSNV